MLKTIKPNRYNNRRRQTRRRNNPPTYGSKYIGMAQKALRIATTVASIINSEGKYLDPNVNSGSMTSAGTITCLTGVARGTGPSDRTGDSILLKLVYLKFLTKWNTSNTDSPSYIRLMLIRDLNDNNDTAPTLSNLLTYPTAPAASVSSLNMLYEERFELLGDKTIYLDSYHGGEVSEFNVSFKPDPNNPTRNKYHATFNGSNGTDTGKGHLYLVQIGSGTTNMNTCTYVGRVFYYDN